MRQPNKIATLMLVVLVLGCNLPLYAASSETAFDSEAQGQEGFDAELDPGDTAFDFEPATASETSDQESVTFEEDLEGDTFGQEAEQQTEDSKPSLPASLLSTARFTLKHETFYKFTRPDGIKSNRTSLRLEYARSIGPHYFIQLDTKQTVFWGDDHRAKAEDKEMTTENFTREAFCQASFADTSIKAGVQILIWGESEGGAITDVISPRDYSEAFFISLEASRIGQPMILVDQFTPMGDVSAFFIPDPEFNKYPEDNSAYHYDEFNDPVRYREESSDTRDYEFGGRWKKTFGQSDVALMAASLIENDYIHRLDGVGADGAMIVTKKKERFALAGLTFNYVRGSFLYKGEIGMKFPQHFNDADMQIEKRDVFDAALGLEYSPGGAYTLGLELVNRHIMDWDSDLVGVRENATSAVLLWEKDFLNETLSVSWISIYSTPDQGYLHTLRTTYKWTDHLSLKFEAFYPDISDPENSLWVYRDQKQVAMKIQAQF
jgi:hypothetical protein